METTPPTTTQTAAPTTEAKPEAKPSAEPKPAADDGKSLLNKEEAPVVPETYADFKVPEGYTLDKALVAEAAPIFKELNLTQDQAQKLVDFYSKTAQAAVDKPYQDFLATRKGWQDQVKADFGSRLPEAKATIGRAIAMLPADVQKDFRATMDMTGAGDNPAFVKAVHFWAEKLSEGHPVTGRGPSPEGQRAPGTPARPSPAAALFPKLPSSATAQ